MKTINTLLITEAASSIATWKSSVLDPQKLGAAALLIKKGTVRYSQTVFPKMDGPSNGGEIYEYF